MKVQKDRRTDRQTETDIQADKDKCFPHFLTTVKSVLTVPLKLIFSIKADSLQQPPREKKVERNNFF